MDFYITDALCSFVKSSSVISCLLNNEQIDEGNESRVEETLTFLFLVGSGSSEMGITQVLNERLFSANL